MSLLLWSPEVAGPHDEAPTGGVELLAVQDHSCRIERREAQAIRMERQHLVPVEQQVHRLVELDYVRAAERQAPGRADALEGGLHAGRIERVRPASFEAEQDRTIGAVTLAGQRKRSVDLRAHFHGPLEHAHCPEVRDERTGGIHRAHRVRTRRADADLEDVEDAEGHGRKRKAEKESG